LKIHGYYCGGVAWPPLQEHLIFGAIVLPVPRPLLYLVVFDIILSNQALYRRKAGLLTALTNRLKGRESGIHRLTELDRMGVHYKDYCTTESLSYGH
jgi:hypothetical protein